MYTDVTLPERVRSYLSELGFPIRVLSGPANQMQPPRRWTGHARANRTTIARCEGEGVTVISWAMDSVSRPGYPWISQNSLPAEVSNDGLRIDTAPLEWVNPSLGVGDPASFGSQNTGLTHARASDRVVWFAMPLDRITDDQWERVDLDTFLGTPIRYAKEQGATAAERERLREERRVRDAELEAERNARRLERQREAAREAFLQAAQEQAQGDRARYEREYNAQEAQVRSYEQAHAQAMQEVERLARLLNALDNGEGWDRDKAEAEWNLLIENPKVVSVRQERHPYAGNCTVITTPELDLTNPDTGESHPLGAFDIFCPAPNSSYLPYFTNLTNPRDGRMHPHVQSNGEACFGGSHSMIGQLVRSGSLAGLFEVLIQYLESYNPDDSWGSYARSWGFGSQEEEESYEESYDDEDYSDDEDGNCNCPECRAARGY